MKNSEELDNTLMRHYAQMEKELRESEQYNRQLLESSPDAIVVHDREGNIITVNAQVEQLFGYRRAELLGQPLEILMPARYRETHIAHRAAYIAQPRMRPMGTGLHIIARRKDGSEFPVDITVSPVHTARGFLALSIIRDITGRQRAEQELRESEELFRQLAENIRDLFFVRDVKENKMLYVSPAYERIWQRPRRTLLTDPRAFISAVYSADRQNVLDALKRQNEGEFFDQEYRIVRPDGEIRWIWARTFPIADAHGQVYRVAGIAEDVTDRKQAQDKLARQAEELARSHAELRRFAFIASHDLQEPLRQVSIYVQMLARRYAGQLDADADEFIDYVIKGTKRLHEMVKGLQEYLRVDMDDAEFVPTNLEVALNSAVTRLHAEIAESGAVVTHSPLPTVSANETQLAQVFGHLLANALKFRRQEPPRIDIAAEERAGEWVLAVRDNGIGIASEYATRIFDIFRQLHNWEEYPGVGIGLTLCKKIVERHGGRIWVESEPDAGSTFYFTLPTV